MYLYDLFPTNLRVGRRSNADVVEGKSLVPICPRQAKVRPYLFAAYRDWQRMVRDKRWKLIEYFVGDQHHTQLFDLSTDPDELKQSGRRREQWRKCIARLRGQMRQMGREFGDPDTALYSKKAIKATLNRPARHQFTSHKESRHRPRSRPTASQRQRSRLADGLAISSTR